jgi:hypothetical protein
LPYQNQESLCPFLGFGRRTFAGLSKPKALAEKAWREPDDGLVIARALLMPLAASPAALKCVGLVPGYGSPEFFVAVNLLASCG